MDFSKLREQFIQHFKHSNNLRYFFSPGRVNLIGEHIDYNGGYVFPAALTLGIGAAVRPNGTNTVRMRSANAAGEINVDLTREIVYNSHDSWGNYPKGVFLYLQRAGYDLIGCDIVFSGNLPDGAGLSSSAAIEVLTAWMMLTMSGAIDIDRVWIAKLCQEVENKFIGVNCGIMDQFSVALGKKDQAILLDCQYLNYHYAPVNMTDHSLIIMNTNKRRELADSKYNERRNECDAALALLNKEYSFNNLCAATMEAINDKIKDPTLYKRSRHVVTENERVIKATEVLKKGDLATFGRLLNESHRSLKEDYEVTGLHLDSIVAAAQAQPGCLGARMTGAGFGGCAIALVENSAVSEFEEKVGATYTKQTGLRADFYTTHVGDGVHEVIVKE